MSKNRQNSWTDLAQILWHDPGKVYDKKIATQATYLKDKIVIRQKGREAP